MSIVIFLTPEGIKHEVQAKDGESVMRTAVSNMVPGIIGECGGELSCATCHVFVDAAWVDRLPFKSDDEEGMLEAAAAEPDETSRLCCQIVSSDETDGLIVHIPEEQ